MIALLFCFTASRKYCLINRATSNDNCESGTIKIPLNDFPMYKFEETEIQIQVDSDPSVNTTIFLDNSNIEKQYLNFFGCKYTLRIFNIKKIGGLNLDSNGDIQFICSTSDSVEINELTIFNEPDFQANPKSFKINSKLTINDKYFKHLPSFYDISSQCKIAIILISTRKIQFHKSKLKIFDVADTDGKSLDKNYNFSFLIYTVQPVRLTLALTSDSQIPYFPDFTLITNSIFIDNTWSKFSVTTSHLGKFITSRQMNVSHEANINYIKNLTYTSPQITHIYGALKGVYNLVEQGDTNFDRFSMAYHPEKLFSYPFIPKNGKIKIRFYGSNVQTNAFKLDGNCVSNTILQLTSSSERYCYLNFTQNAPKSMEVTTSHCVMELGSVLSFDMLNFGSNEVRIICNSNFTLKSTYLRFKGSSFFIGNFDIECNYLHCRLFNSLDLFDRLKGSKIREINLLTPFLTSDTFLTDVTFCDDYINFSCQIDNVQIPYNIYSSLCISPAVAERGNAQIYIRGHFDKLTTLPQLPNFYFSQKSDISLIFSGNWNSVKLPDNVMSSYFSCNGKFWVKAENDFPYPSNIFSFSRAEYLTNSSGKYCLIESLNLTSHCTPDEEMIIYHRNKVLHNFKKESRIKVAFPISIYGQNFDGRSLSLFSAHEGMDIQVSILWENYFKPIKMEFVNLYVNFQSELGTSKISIRTKELVLSEGTLISFSSSISRVAVYQRLQVGLANLNTLINRGILKPCDSLDLEILSDSLRSVNKISLLNDAIMINCLQYSITVPRAFYGRIAIKAVSSLDVEVRVQATRGLEVDRLFDIDFGTFSGHIRFTDEWYYSNLKLSDTFIKGRIMSDKNSIVSIESDYFKTPVEYFNFDTEALHSNTNSLICLHSPEQIGECPVASHAIHFHPMEVVDGLDQYGTTVWAVIVGSSENNYPIINDLSKIEKFTIMSGNDRYSYVGVNGETNIKNLIMTDTVMVHPKNLRVNALSMFGRSKIVSDSQVHLDMKLSISLESLKAVSDILRTNGVFCYLLVFDENDIFEIEGYASNYSINGFTVENMFTDIKIVFSRAVNGEQSLYLVNREKIKKPLPSLEFNSLEDTFIEIPSDSVDSTEPFQATHVRYGAQMYVHYDRYPIILKSAQFIYAGKPLCLTRESKCPKTHIEMKYGSDPINISGYSSVYVMDSTQSNPLTIKGLSSNTSIIAKRGETEFVTFLDSEVSNLRLCGILAKQSGFKIDELTIHGDTSILDDFTVRVLNIYSKAIPQRITAEQINLFPSGQPASKLEKETLLKIDNTKWIFSEIVRIKNVTLHFRGMHLLVTFDGTDETIKNLPNIAVCKYAGVPTIEFDRSWKLDDYKSSNGGLIFSNEVNFVVKSNNLSVPSCFKVLQQNAEMKTPRKGFYCYQLEKENGPPCDCPDFASRISGGSIGERRAQTLRSDDDGNLVVISNSPDFDFKIDANVKTVVVVGDAGGIRLFSQGHEIDTLSFFGKSIVIFNRTKIARVFSYGPSIVVSMEPLLVRNELRLSRISSSTILDYLLPSPSLRLFVQDQTVQTVDVLRDEILCCRSSEIECFALPTSSVGKVSLLHEKLPLKVSVGSDGARMPDIFMQPSVVLSLDPSCYNRSVAERGRLSSRYGALKLNLPFAGVPEAVEVQPFEVLVTGRVEQDEGDEEAPVPVPDPSPTPAPERTPRAGANFKRIALYIGIAAVSFALAVLVGSVAVSELCLGERLEDDSELLGNGRFETF